MCVNASVATQLTASALSAQTALNTEAAAEMTFDRFLTEPPLPTPMLRSHVVLQAGEKLALQDKTKGDVIMQLVPLIDNFEAAKNAIKVQSDAEQKIVDSYQVRLPLCWAACS